MSARILSLAALLSLLAACGDNGTANSSGGNTSQEWTFNNGPALDMRQERDLGEDSADFGLPPGNQSTPLDMGPPPAPVDMSPPVDMAPPTPLDMGPPPAPDMSAPAQDMSQPVDAGSPDGFVCATTSECSTGSVCCPNFGGDNTCTPDAQCFVGGTCELDAECPGQKKCCDFSQFGVSEKVCRDRCSGGMMNTGCQNNTECAGGEVCCPSFGGAPACVAADQCNNGGRCQMDADCLNNQSCCAFGGNGVCLNQCGF